MRNRRFTSVDIDEGKLFLQYQKIPERLLHGGFKQQRLTSFRDKWKDVQLINNELYVNNKQIVSPVEMDDILTKTYMDPISTGGRDHIFDLLSKKYYNISRAEVMEFLRNQESYQLHIKRNKATAQQATVIRGAFLKFQIDFSSMSKLAGHNNGNRYVFTCIDVYTKYAYAYPLRRRHGSLVVEVLQRILDESPRFPHIIQSDNEFRQ